VIVRRERPHPGAQLSFSDHDGHRFQAILTDQPETDIAALERQHRARARVEDRIRAAKDCGLTNLPFRDFDANAVWLELVLAAQELLFYAQTLCLTGELARAEPKKAALPAAAHRRTPGLPRPRRDPAPAPRLALGHRSGRRLRPPGRAARPLTLGRSRNHDHAGRARRQPAALSPPTPVHAREPADTLLPASRRPPHSLKLPRPAITTPPDRLMHDPG
jgi:hypothetical protein